MKDILANKTRYELIDIIERLSLECDTRHAHEDALEEQLRGLGIAPENHTFLDQVWAEENTL